MSTVYRVMDESGTARYSSRLEDLPMHKDWIIGESLQKIPADSSTTTDEGDIE